jgi:hypothetical protein
MFFSKATVFVVMISFAGGTSTAAGGREGGREGKEGVKKEPRYS